MTVADLEPLGTLGTRDVKVYTATGRLPGREVLVGGWSRPLAFAGLTRKEDYLLGKMIANALRHEP